MVQSYTFWGISKVEDIRKISSIVTSSSLNGVELIRKKTGYTPKTIIKIDVSGKLSRVL